MGRLIKVLALSAFTACASIGFAAADDSLRLTIYPSGSVGSGLKCRQFAVERDRSSDEESGSVLFRVAVAGADRVRWKLPLWDQQSGPNGVAVSRIGDSRLQDQRVLAVRLLDEELANVGSRELVLSVESEDGRIARCPINPLKNSEERSYVVESALSPLR